MATVVYDGECSFCRQCAAWAAARDRRNTYVARQEADLDETTAAWARRSVLWVDGERVLDQAAVCVRVLWSMHFGWRIAGTLLWLVPKPLRDLGYRFVAKKWGPL